MRARRPAARAARILPAALLGIALSWVLAGPVTSGAPFAGAVPVEIGALPAVQAAPELTSAAEVTPAAITPAAAVTSVATLPRWTGGMDLYRRGVYSMQATWYWCTAANAQIMRNMARGERDHASASQGRYFTYMRAHDRYVFPVRDGSDPQGWAAGLARFVDGRYRLQTYTSYDAAMRDAVTRMRLTQLPVSLAVMDGNHAWVLHGFTATADPAVTRAFRITSVRVTGPLWGRQSVNGYDMPPDTKLSYDAFRRFFRPFHYAPVHMVWDGRYVTVQPIPRVAAPAAPTAAPTPAFVPRLQLVTQPRMIRV